MVKKWPFFITSSLICCLHLIFFPPVLFYFATLFCICFLSCTPVTWDLFTYRMLECLLTLPLLLWWWLLHWHHVGLRRSGAVSWWVWWSFLSKSWVTCITFGGRRDVCILTVKAHSAVFFFCWFQCKSMWTSYALNSMDISCKSLMQIINVKFLYY